MTPPTDVARRTGDRVRRVIFTREQIADRVRELGSEISACYDPREELLVLGLLKGSFMFLADLAPSLGRSRVSAAWQLPGTASYSA